MSLTTETLAVRFGNQLAVRPLNLDLAPGELIGLVGPNGAGKTSLLRALAGIVSADGHVSWNGRHLEELAADDRARTIAYLPQAPQANWPISVRELVELGRLPHRRYGQQPTDQDHRAVQQAISRTGIAPLSDRAIDTLSGGERMRAHLARAFAVDAPVLLVDEPVASLDPYHQLSVMRLLSEYRDAGRLVIAVLHDLNLALGSCTRLLLMDSGSIVADGRPADIIDTGTLARHYRIRAWITEHESRRVAVPWEMLPSDE
jgi:iron complex transport system ATP-binding protein